MLLTVQAQRAQQEQQVLLVLQVRPAQRVLLAQMEPTEQMVQTE